MKLFGDLLIAFAVGNGMFNLACADLPLKSTDVVKQRCATVACASFLLALVLMQWR
jgi:hypothetical protein